MRSFWDIVNHVLEQSDIILMVLDARFPEQTENKELKDKAGNKPILYVLNKSDLADKDDLFKWKQKHPNSVFISAMKHQGTTILLRKIMEISQGKHVTVGVVGYPNTGKSSVINALKGRKSAGTSPHAGFTKSKKLIRITEDIYLLDTPGVLPYLEKNDSKLSLIGATDPTKLKDPDLAVFELIRHKKNIICKHYGIKETSNEKIIENIAIKYKKLVKGGQPNINETAKMILRDWQRGKIS